MATQTYEPIATFTSSGGETEITISSIPGTYRDLVLTIAGTSSTATGFAAKINGSLSGLSTVYIYGDGANPVGNVATTESNIGTLGANGGMGHVEFFDYSVTGLNKTFISKGFRPGSPTIAAAYANVWANTAPITSLGMVIGAGTMNAGVVISLYGIAG